MKIQDIIDTLTEEEKEQHKELVEECLNKEKMLENCNGAKSLKELVDKLFLALLPDKNFFRE